MTGAAASLSPDKDCGNALLVLRRLCDQRVAEGASSAPPPAKAAFFAYRSERTPRITTEGNAARVVTG